MYSTTADRMHHHGRTGSYATRGSARGIIHQIPWWAESVVEEDGVVETTVPHPMDQRIPVSLDRLDRRVWTLRVQLKTAHKAGDMRLKEKTLRFLRRVSRLRNAVREQARNYSAN